MIPFVLTGRVFPEDDGSFRMSIKAPLETDFSTLSDFRMEGPASRSCSLILVCCCLTALKSCTTPLEKNIFVETYNINHNLHFVSGRAGKIISNRQDYHDNSIA